MMADSETPVRRDRIREFFERIFKHAPLRTKFVLQAFEHEVYETSTEIAVASERFLAVPRKFAKAADWCLAREGEYALRMTPLHHGPSPNETWTTALVFGAPRGTRLDDFRVEEQRPSFIMNDGTRAECWYLLANPLLVSGDSLADVQTLAGEIAGRFDVIWAHGPFGLGEGRRIPGLRQFQRNLPLEDRRIASFEDDLNWDRRFRFTAPPQQEKIVVDVFLAGPHQIMGIAGPPQTQEAIPEPVLAPRGRMERQGRVWLLEFDGVEAMVEHRIGMARLARILKVSPKGLSSRDLAKKASRHSRSAVSRSLEAAYRAIEKKHQRLGEHLRVHVNRTRDHNAYDSVKTGVEWDVSH